MRVVALAAGTNVERLADQIATHLPEVVSVDTETAAHDLRAMLFARDVDLPRIVIGEAGLIEVATHPQADCVISATSRRRRFCSDTQSTRDGQTRRTR